MLKQAAKYEEKYERAEAWRMLRWAIELAREKDLKSIEIGTTILNNLVRSELVSKKDIILINQIVGTVLYTEKEE